MLLAQACPYKLPSSVDLLEQPGHVLAEDLADQEEVVDRVEGVDDASPSPGNPPAGIWGQHTQFQAEIRMVSSECGPSHRSEHCQGGTRKAYRNWLAPHPDDRVGGIGFLRHLAILQFSAVPNWLVSWLLLFWNLTEFPGSRRDRGLIRVLAQIQLDVAEADSVRV